MRRWLAGAVFFVAAVARSQSPTGEVTLPLSNYLALVEAGELRDRERVARQERREPAIAEVLSQRLAVRVEESAILARSELEVLVAGGSRVPIVVPHLGLVTELSVRPTAGAALRATPAGLELIVAQDGRYQLQIGSRAPLPEAGGVTQLSLPAVAASVAVLELDLASDRAWSVERAVVVAEAEKNGRRQLQLTARRGEQPVLELRRRADDDEAQELLAQSVVVTLVELRLEGRRRTDLVLWEVQRGSLTQMEVDLPERLQPERTATDEGVALPLVDGRRLTVERSRRLRSTGFLSVESALGAGETLPLEAVQPHVEVRARYLAVAAAVAAEVTPEPKERWTRVDLEDLPQTSRSQLASAGLTAAWRLIGEAPEAELKIASLPAAETLAVLVESRETTTLLTVDGTLLHRERLTLRQAGAALDLELPAGAHLWSARVGDLAVRPLEQGGRIRIPLPAVFGPPPPVEVVAVLERALPRGRSELRLEPLGIAAPVLEHRWRLLLPADARYRFRQGDLAPAPEIGWISTSAQIRELPETGAVSVGGSGGVGRLVGRVVDYQNAALPGVTVELSSLGAAPRIVVSDAQGRFQFQHLAAGRYTLKASLQGFSTIEYPNVQISEARGTQLEVTLTPAVEETITVTSETPLLDERSTRTTSVYQTDQSTGGYTFGRKKQPTAPPAPSPQQAGEAYRREIENLSQGLVGGLKPVPVEIPESGKALLLTAVLPPGHPVVELEARAPR